MRNDEHSLWSKWPRAWTTGLMAAALVLWAHPAQAAPKPDNPVHAFVGLLTVAVLLVVLGLAVGSFGLTVNHVFRQRSGAAFGVMRQRPGLSLLAGVLITVLGLGLIAVLQVAPPLQLLVLLAFLIGLASFAIGAAARLTGSVVEPLPAGVGGDGPPDARAHVKGGLVLISLNVVPILGSILCFGILLSGVGATLLSYFSAFGPKQPAAAQAPPAPPAPSEGLAASAGEAKATEPVAPASTDTPATDEESGATEA